MAYTETRTQEELMYEEMWNLDTSRVVEGAWWWWWWIFFIKNKEDPGKTKQVMILWSTKNKDWVKVNDFPWSRRKNPVREDDGVMRFNGMPAAWYFDGEKMIEPLVLKDCDFELTREEDGSGCLHPIAEGCNYDFKGNLDRMEVFIQDEKADMHFVMTPWNEKMSELVFSKKDYTKKYNYSILKQYGTKLEGTIDGESIEGSAYFQKLLVNAPQVPWYWVITHAEDGSFLDYFYPNVGLQILRKNDRHKSFCDRVEKPLSKGVVFYHKGTDQTYKFKDMKIRHEYENDLPIFYIEADSRDGRGHIHLKYETYSRAYWRFEQKAKLMKPILFYNEYPSTLTEFDMTYDDLHVTLADLGYTVSNNEHTWGKLI